MAMLREFFKIFVILIWDLKLKVIINQFMIQNSMIMMAQLLHVTLNGMILIHLIIKQEVHMSITNIACISKA